MPVQHQEITVTRLGFESKKTPRKKITPSLLTARLAPLPTSIQFHEIFDTDLYWLPY